MHAEYRHHRYFHHLPLELETQMTVCRVSFKTLQEDSQLKEDGEPLERLNSSPYSTAMLGWLVRLPGW